MVSNPKHTQLATNGLNMHTTATLGVVDVDRSRRKIAQAATVELGCGTDETEWEKGLFFNWKTALMSLRHSSSSMVVGTAVDGFRRSQHREIR